MGRKIEERNDEGRVTDMAGLVFATGYLNNLNRKLQGKENNSLYRDVQQESTPSKSSFSAGKNKPIKTA